LDVLLEASYFRYFFAYIKREVMDGDQCEPLPQARF